MANEKKNGDISVSMGNGNTVDHIGHKIVYQSPPPSPNAIWQGGVVIGEIGGQPVNVQGKLVFPLLFFEGPFDPDREFSVQDVTVRLEKCDSEGIVSFGARPTRKLRNAVCRLIS